MSLESQIAAMVQAAASVLQVPAQIAAQARASIDAAVAAFIATTASPRGFFVHQTAGSDAPGQPGSEAAPLATISEALRRVHVGGVCKVYLMAPYVMTADISVEGRYLQIISLSAARHVLSFSTYVDPSNTAYIKSRGFACSFGASVTIYGLTVELPPLVSGSTLSRIYSSICFGVDLSPFNFFLHACDVSLPVSPAASLVSTWGQTVGLGFSATTLIGAPLIGRVVASHTNTTTPTPSSSLPWLQTTLMDV